MFCGLPDFIAMTLVRLLSQMLAFFFRVELSGNVSKFKKKKEILLRTFTSSMRHRVRKIHQNSRRSRAGTTKNCILCVASAKKKGRGGGRTARNQGERENFLFSPIPSLFVPPSPSLFDALNYFVFQFYSYSNDHSHKTEC